MLDLQTDKRMTISDFLFSIRETIPAWLLSFQPLPEFPIESQPAAAFPRSQFFSSRCVYYPGGGFDGHPVKLFGSSHSAHCFVYADYAVTQEE
jgi:hypothetical protein